MPGVVSSAASLLSTYTSTLAWRADKDGVCIGEWVWGEPGGVGQVRLGEFGPATLENGLDGRRQIWRWRGRDMGAWGGAGARVWGRATCPMHIHVVVHGVQARECARVCARALGMRDSVDDTDKRTLFGDGRRQSGVGRAAGRQGGRAADGPRESGGRRGGTELWLDGRPLTFMDKSVGQQNGGGKGRKRRRWRCRCRQAPGSQVQPNRLVWDGRRPACIIVLEVHVYLP
jgi:hypothetical protein